MTIQDFYTRDKQHFLETMVDAIQDGIVVLDRGLKIVHANRWMEIKYAAQKPLPGKTCHEVFKGSADAWIDCPFLKALESGKVQRQVIPYPPAETPLEWFEISVFLLRDDEGRMIGSVGHVKDITKRRLTEERLQEEMIRRHILVEQSRDGIVILEQSGKVFEANRRFAEMLGYSMEEVQHLCVWDWDCKWTREQLLHMTKAVDERGDHFETRHRRKDGTIYDVEISTNGAVYHGRKLIFCVCRDVSERKQTEARLMDEVIRRRLLFEQSRDGIVILNEDGQVIEANHRYAEMLGYTMDEIQQLHIWDWDVKWTKDQLLEMSRAVDDHGHCCETRHRRKDGTLLDVEINANGAVHRGQRLIFCVCRDISERKQTEARLRDELVRRRILVEQSRDGIVVLDQNGKVIEANQRYAEMLGYTMDEIHHLHVWDWDVKWTREQLLEMIRTVDNSGDHFETRHRRKDGTLYDVEISTNGAHFETRHRRKDGTLYDVEVKTNETVFQGQKLIFCVCRDITTRKHAENERDKLIRELREASKEIKTLRGILPFCSFCKKIRNDKGYWEQVDIYIEKYSHADVTHGVCPDCMRRYYPDLIE